jgi:hypothetical protein
VGSFLALEHLPLWLSSLKIIYIKYLQYGHYTCVLE